MADEHPSMPAATADLALMDAAPLPRKRPAQDNHGKKKKKAHTTTRTGWHKRGKCTLCDKVGCIDQVAFQICSGCMKKHRAATRGSGKATRPGNEVNRREIDSRNAQRRYKHAQPIVNGTIRAPPQTRGEQTAPKPKQIKAVAICCGGGVSDKPFSVDPFNHILAADTDTRFKPAVEENLHTTFIELDLNDVTVQGFAKHVKEAGAEPGSNLHLTVCLCCKQAASGEPIDYAKYEEQIKKVVEIRNKLAASYKLTVFGEFLAIKRMVGLYRTWFKDADIVVLPECGQENRTRMLIADGFKLTGLEDEVTARCAGAKTVTETTGAGKLRSNTGSQAKWKPTEEGIGSITTTGYKFMDTNGNVTQLSKEVLMELRSQGAKHTYDLSMVSETLGRVIVGQAVSLVIAEVAAERCATAHLDRW
jgi:hypothetical protein